jgi:shikimate dehydrogenase
MHNAGFKALGLEYAYVAFPTADTEMAVNAIRDLRIKGASLTIPHKERALSLVDEISAECSEIKAVNTIINENGKLRGLNTDAASKLSKKPG